MIHILVNWFREIFEALNSNKKWIDLLQELKNIQGDSEGNDNTYTTDAWSQKSGEKTWYKYGVRKRFIF